jgi:hypothetical protein
VKKGGGGGVRAQVARQCARPKYISKSSSLMPLVKPYRDPRLYPEFPLRLVHRSAAEGILIVLFADHIKKLVTSIVNRICNVPV